MLILVGLAVFAIVAGWLIGHPRALALTILMPILAVISRIQQERNGHPPETRVLATVLFTVAFALLIAAGCCCDDTLRAPAPPRRTVTRARAWPVGSSERALRERERRDVRQPAVVGDAQERGVRVDALR